MIDYVFEPKEQIKNWVLNEINFPCQLGDEYGAMGAIKDGEPIGGVIFHDLKILTHGYEVEMTLAGKKGQLWLTSKGIKLAMIYVFLHLDCVRLVVSVHPDNTESKKLIEKFGFVLEGRLRERYGPGQDVLVYSLLRSECKWLPKEGNNR